MASSSMAGDLRVGLLLLILNELALREWRFTRYSLFMGLGLNFFFSSTQSCPVIPVVATQTHFSISSHVIVTCIIGMDSSFKRFSKFGCTIERRVPKSEPWGMPQVARYKGSLFRLPVLQKTIFQPQSCPTSRCYGSGRLKCSYSNI